MTVLHPVALQPLQNEAFHSNLWHSRCRVGEFGGNFLFIHSIRSIKLSQKYTTEVNNN